MSESVDDWRHFFAAVMALATLPGSLVERVGHAYWNDLKRIRVNAGLPAQWRTEFLQMMARLERLYPTPEGRDVDAREAARIAKQMLRLYDRMTRMG